MSILLCTQLLATKCHLITAQSVCVCVRACMCVVADCNHAVSINAVMSFENTQSIHLCIYMYIHIY